jgi:hypothetical protein
MAIVKVKTECIRILDEPYLNFVLVKSQVRAYSNARPASQLLLRPLHCEPAGHCAR